MALVRVTIKSATLAGFWQILVQQEFPLENRSYQNTIVTCELLQNKPYGTNRAEAVPLQELVHSPIELRHYLVA